MRGRGARRHASESRMEFPIACQLADRRTDKKVRGSIRPATDHEMLLWTRWRYASDDEDRRWDWWNFYLECKASKGRYECYALIAREELQGLMMLNLKRHRTVFRVVVDYLSTNPANRSSKQGLRHIGTALIGVAALRSLECGGGGVISLESLPGAERFYESLGFMKKPLRSLEGNSMYNLEAAVAKELLDHILKQ